MSRCLTLLFAIVLTLPIIYLTGCEAEESLTEPERDPIAAEAKVDSANVLLENALMHLINDAEIQGPDDIDLTQPYNAYVDALQSDDTHPGANFGAGILEVIMLTQDAEIQDFYTRVEEFAERDDLFEVDIPGGRMLQAGPQLRIGEVRIPITAPLALAKNSFRTAADDDLTIDELQNIFITEIIPRIESAITRLNIVTENDDFTFNVSPRMQGDPNEDPVELDLTEVYATLVGLEVQLALFSQFCAYNINFESYTGEALLAAFTPGSPFMALNDGGAKRMRDAGQAWLDAINNLDAGISFLESETDYQGDDLIIIDRDDGVTLSDLDSIKHYIPLARNTFTTSEVFSLDLGGDIEDVEISFANFFNSPVADMKSLIPAYSVNLDTVVSDLEYFHESENIPATVQIDNDDFYRWTRSANYEYGVRYYFWEDINFYASDLDDAWDDWEAQLSDKPWASIYFSFSGFLETGQRNIDCFTSISYDEPTAWRYAPQITWVADSFAEWVFPDPTFGGLFPGMTDSRFKRIIDISADDWKKTTTLDMWDGDDDYPPPPEGP